MGKTSCWKYRLRPGRPFRIQLRDIVNADAIFRQRRHQFRVPEFVLSRDQLVHHALNGVEGFRRRHPIRPDVARLARDLLLDTRDANLEELIKIVGRKWS